MERKSSAFAVPKIGTQKLDFLPALRITPWHQGGPQQASDQHLDALDQMPEPQPEPTELKPEAPGLHHEPPRLQPTRAST